MRIKNTKTSFGSISIFSHWLIALLIIGLIIIGFYMVALPLGLQKVRWYGWHKQVGMLVLILAILRILWQYSNITPLLPAHIPNWQKVAARLAHFSLYALMLLLPITGWLLSSAAGFSVSLFGLFVLPDFVAPSAYWQHFFTQTHNWLGYALIAVIAGHAGAAFYHHFIYRDDVLRRMFPWI